MRRFLTALALLAALMPRAAQAKTIVVILEEEAEDGTVAQPFVDATNSFRASLTPQTIVHVGPKYDPAYTEQTVRLANPDVIVAFGAASAQFAAQRFPSVPRVVTLAPGIVPAGNGQPEVLINAEVPVPSQVKWIGDVLPDVQKVGVLYDKRYTQTLVDELSAAASALPRGKPLSIVPIDVSDETQVEGAFKAALPSIQALDIIPDPTVLGSTGAVQALMKRALAAQIPVIGFDHYFVENGAVLGICVDYAALGQQAAHDALQVATNHTGNSEAPKGTHIWVNARVAAKLRIRIDYDPTDKKHVSEIR